jgi:hypothetical protein
MGETEKERHTRLGVDEEEEAVVEEKENLEERGKLTIAGA